MAKRKSPPKPRDPNALDAIKRKASKTNDRRLRRAKEKERKAKRGEE